MSIFNRHNPDVKQNATSLTLEEFLDKYKDTSANATVLTSVYKNFNKTKTLEAKVETNAEAATTFVTPAPKEEENASEPTVVDTPEKLKSFQKKEKASNKKEEKVKPVAEVKPVAVEDKKTTGDKPGRTPRMRELMKIHGKDDKQKIKRLLVEEGFNCEGSGFHSEWNRVSKAK